MKGKKKLILAAAVVLIAAFLLVNGFISSRGLKVETAAAEIGTIKDYYTEEGTLSFGQEYVMVSKVSGPVKEVCVKENDLVSEGDVLFIVDDRDIRYEKSLYESNIAGLRAQLDQSRINQLVTTSPQEYMDSLRRETEAYHAEYQSAKTVYEASGSLYSSGSISRVEWETNKAGYETALAAWQKSKGRYDQSRELLAKLGDSGIDEASVNSKFYDSAIAALEAELHSTETSAAQIEDRLEDCIITADRNGTVASVPVKEMSAIDAGTPAVVLNSHDKMEAKAEVLTSIAPYLKVGDPVTVTMRLRGKDTVYEGVLSEVYDFAAKGVSALGLDEYRVRVKTDITDTDGLTERNGYDVMLKFVLFEGEDKLWVPSSAVFRADNQDYVFVLDGGTAVRVPVEVEYKTGTQAVIQSGIEAGARVITIADEEGLYDGARVYEQR